MARLLKLSKQVSHPLSSSFLSVPDLLCKLARRHIFLDCDHMKVVQVLRKVRANRFSEAERA